MKTSVLIYKSMILPYIDYGDIVYEAATKAVLSPLIVQTSKTTKQGTADMPPV